MNRHGLVCVIEWTIQHIQKAMTEDGITIGYVDPRAIIPLTGIDVELQAEEWYNLFLIRKQAS